MNAPTNSRSMTDEMLDELLHLLAVWRVELVLLALPTGLGLWLYVRLGLVFAIAAPVALITTVLCVGPLRRFLGRLLHRASVRRHLEAAFRALPGVLSEKRPRIVKITRTAFGDRVELVLWRGTSVDDLVKVEAVLAASLGVRQVRCVANAAKRNLVSLTITRDDPFSVEALRCPLLDAKRTSLWDAVPVGVDEDGETVTLSLPERNVLLGGEPGAGKSVALSLLAAYEDSDLFRAAVGQAQLQARDGHSRHDDELLAVTSELAKVDASVDRYLRAFESGSMPEALCGERVKELATRATVLRARREELNEEMEQADITCASPEELATLRDRVNEAIVEGSPAVVKSLLQALIHEIRVDSRNAIQPVFRVPLAGDAMAGDAVRAPSRSVALSTPDTNKWLLLMENRLECQKPDVSTASDNQLVGPIRHRQRRLTEAQVNEMATRYQEGATVYELATEFGCNRTTVATRLKKAGITMRGQSPTSEDIDSMVRLFEIGISPPEVGRQLGFCANTVRACLRECRI